MADLFIIGQYDGVASIFFIGTPFITAYNIISSIFRGMGDSKSPVYFIAVVCATYNVVHGSPIPFVNKEWDIFLQL